MADDEIYFASIGELGANLQSREISAVELARVFGRRLAQLAPFYKALALPLSAEGIPSAKAVDSDLKRERLRGPLQGIPYAVNDMLALAGRPTTWGAAPYASQVFDYSAAIIEKLDRVGAPLVGKLALAELAGAGRYCSTADPFTGPALNPWNRTRWAGGSCGGSAAAVAAGLVPFAIGSETSGDILAAAAYCGVTALRPTYGLVSRYGAMAVSWTLDTLGPFCRSAEDCGLVLQAISGGDRRDPGSAGKSFYYTPQYARKLPDLRVGFAAVDFEKGVDPEAVPAIRVAAEVIRQSGVKVAETKPPDFPYGAVIGTILSAEGSAAFEPLIESGAVVRLSDAGQIAGLRAGLEIPARQYLKAMRIRRLIHDAFRKLFVDVDVLLAPACLGPASAVEGPVNRRAMNELQPAGNLAGLPSLVLPCGFAGNLPVAIQLVGRPFSENTLLALGREFQSRTDWHRRKPPET